MSHDTKPDQQQEPVVEKISDLLEERRGDRRKKSDVPTYMNPELERRRQDRRKLNS